MKVIDRAIRKLGLKVNGTKLRFHDLRHFFGTWLHREGVTLGIVGELLGHKDRSTTDRYITVDRIKAGQHLLSMPEIEIKEQKKSSANM